MITRLIYLLLFVSPQLLLYLYLRERLPDPTRPERARRVRIGLATTFAIFNLPWVLVAGRALSGSMWGVGRIPYLGPWIAWQLLGWIFGVLVAVYVIVKLVVRGSRELGAVLLRARRTAEHRDEPLPAPGSLLSRRRFLARATYSYAAAGAALSTSGIWSAYGLPRLTRRTLTFPNLPPGRGGATLALLGIDDPHNWTADDPQPDDVAAALRPAPPAAFKILLAHRPGAWDTAVPRGIPLTLAGHIHGGQLYLPGIGWSPGRLITKYVMGHFQRGDSQLYVSRGIGVVGVPIRVFAPPEIELFTLRRA